MKMFYRIKYIKKERLARELAEKALNKVEDEVKEEEIIRDNEFSKQ